MKASITLLDVARAAGVSKTTVSNAFNAPDRVRPELRARIEAAAQAIGYTGPDPMGRVLSSGRVNQIGVVGAADFGFAWVFSNPYMAQFLKGAAQICEEHGASLSMLAPQQLLNAVADGFILFSRAQLDLVQPALRRKLPFAVIEGVDDTDVNVVTIDNRGGARLLTEHLLALGHRKFAVATLTRQAVSPLVHLPGESRTLVAGWPGDQERLGGVADALAAAGLSIEDASIVEACGSAEERELYGFDWADLLFDNLNGATAIIALGADLALSALPVARRRGFRIPEDLSLGCFDDPPEAALADPPLTAIAQPVLEIGRTAARLLLDRGLPQHLTIPVSLHVRGSTAAAKI